VSNGQLVSQLVNLDYSSVHESDMVTQTDRQSVGRQAVAS